jgi:hypothetical protein
MDAVATDRCPKATEGSPRCKQFLTTNKFGRCRTHTMNQRRMDGQRRTIQKIDRLFS